MLTTLPDEPDAFVFTGACPSRGVLEHASTVAGSDTIAVILEATRAEDEAS